MKEKKENKQEIKIDSEHILKLAELSRLSLSDKEVEMYKTDLNNIVQHFSDIQKFDLDNVEPLTNVLDQINVFRGDESLPPLNRDDVLDNSPDNDGVHFQVPCSEKEKEWTGHGSKNLKVRTGPNLEIC